METDHTSVQIEVLQPEERDEAKNNDSIVDEHHNDDNNVGTQIHTSPVYHFDNPWINTCICNTEFENLHNTKGFLKGCKWSPDGTCLLTCANDNILRFFDLPQHFYQDNKLPCNAYPPVELIPSLRIKEGELIYDFCWHPHMSSWQPETCLLASTSKNCPIHLWDAYSGKLMNTFRAYNSVDEVEAAYSLCFSPCGEKLLSGFNSCVRIFDVNRPGRDCDTISTNGSDSLARQSGIISCIAVNPALPSVYAAGSYMKSIGLYSEPDRAPLCVLEGHKGGVTHIKFSPDGLVLYSGGRKDPEILCWDLRNPGQVLFIMNRTVETNQRIYFDLSPSGRYLVSGETNGEVRIWDTFSGMELKANENSVALHLPELCQFRAHNDCTNGISCHPWLPLVATTSGQRHVTPPFNCIDSSSDSDEGDSENESDQNFLRRENSVKLWWTGTVAEPRE